MSVIPLTLFFSLLLAGLFMVLFAHEQRRRRFASTERDSLLPLANERPKLAASAKVERGLRTRLDPVQPVRPSLGDGGRPGSTQAGSVGATPNPEDDDLYF